MRSSAMRVAAAVAVALAGLSVVQAQRRGADVQTVSPVATIFVRRMGGQTAYTLHDRT